MSFYWTDDVHDWRKRSRELEEKQRRKDARHNIAVRRKNEQTCHARPNDHRDRTIALMDDHGSKARIHTTEEREPDEDFVRETWGHNLSEIREPEEDE